MKMMTNDVRRAYFHAASPVITYIELPEEDRTEEDEKNDMVAVLNLALYGTRSAAAAWQATATGYMEAIGFNRGKSNPCVFEHKARELRTILHAGRT